MTEEEKKKLYEDIMREIAPKVEEAIDRAFNRDYSTKPVTVHPCEILLNDCENFDIDRIPLELRKKAYYDYYDAFQTGQTLDSQVSYFKDIKINEANLTIDDISKLNDEDKQYASCFIELYDLLKSRYGFQKWQLKINNDNDTINGIVETIKYEQKEFVAVIPDIRQNAEIIKTECRDYGYYLFNFVEKEDKNGMKWILMILNPLKQKVYNDFVKIFPTILHYAPISCDESIKKDGLLASFSTGSATYDSARIFFKLGDKDLSSGFKKMMSHIADRNRDINQTREFREYVIFVDDIIDDVIFYKDPNIKGCCYCKENIPYEYLHVRYNKSVKF